MPIKQFPFFTVIVPTYNRPDHLMNCLQALAHLDYPGKCFEVIIVDDGGNIPLEPIISRFHNQISVTLLRQKNSGPAMARNYGASRAQGEYLAFTDDDCMPDPNWLQALAYSLKESPDCLCGGKTINAFADNYYAMATQLLSDYLYEHYNPTQKIGGFFLANNIAVDRKRFHEIEGFDPTLRFGEDRDFCYRWGGQKYPFRFVPEALVYHAHFLRLSSFLRCHFHYGKGNFQFLRRCINHRGTPIQLSPPSWYVSLILSGIKKVNGLRGYCLTFLLIVAQGAYGVGILSDVLRNFLKNLYSTKQLFFIKT